MSNKKGRAYSLPIVVIIALCVLMNAAAWLSTAFSDFYVTHIFPVLTSLYGRITSLFPFSVGEVLLVFIIIYIVFTVIFTISHTAYLAVLKIGNKKNVKPSGIRKILDFISDLLYRMTPILLTIAITLMTLNCFVLYHTSKLSIGNVDKAEYTVEDLAKLRDFVVTKCNELSKEVPHDENGNVSYDGDMKREAVYAMEKLGEEFPRLSGYYVTPKALYFSDFMCQQYMQGYYFPFSMEANYNDTMNLMNKPFTMCHELAHTHGFIYEDEANFLGFLACIRSDDIVFKYSGYLGVLNYINNDFYNAVDKKEYNRHVKILDRVKYDNEFLSKDGWKEVEDNAIFKTETVKKAADTFIDTNLKVNGVLDGKVSYRYVVGLIMDYYYLYGV